jgi:hypothetical protein
VDNANPITEEHRLLEIIRVAYRDDGTFGVLLDCGHVGEINTAGEPFAVTCEEVWRDNAPNVSCIPTGFYLCRRFNSPKFGPTYEITGVNGRSLILFHPGNDIRHTEGCVLTAEQFERLEGRMSVAQSRKGFDELLERVKGLDEFALSVRDA